MRHDHHRPDPPASPARRLSSRELIHGRGPATADPPGHGQVRLAEINEMSPPSALRTAFQEALFPGTPGQQHGLMEAYPALGDEAVAERAASEDPTLDQASAAMTSRTEDEDRAFREVTTAYQEEFGSPAHRCASTVL